MYNERHVPQVTVLYLLTTTNEITVEHFSVMDSLEPEC